MRDVELYQAVLGIQSPWRVSKVALALEEGRVDVWVEHGRGERFACPECSKSCAVYDHMPERTWRHLDTCQYVTQLHAAPPRIRCETHGIKQVRLAWAEPKSRFTLLFERFAIDVLLATDIAHAAKILRVSWDEAFAIKERAVKRGQARREAEPAEPTRVGVDEKSPGKQKAFFTIVSDLDTKTVRWIGDGLKGATLDAYWAERTPEELGAIECIAMDMGQAYFGSALRNRRDHV